MYAVKSFLCPSIEAYYYVHVHNCMYMLIVMGATQSQLMSYVQCYGFILRFQVVNHNIPYSDTFFVACRYCITRVTHNQTRLRIMANIKFKKTCWRLYSQESVTNIIFY